MSASKAKGTRFESDVVGYLKEHGFQWAERRAQGGSKDRGDIAGVLGWVLECKAEKAISLAGYVEEARTEGGNAGLRWFAAIVKRRNKGPGDAYVVMPLSVFCDYVRDEQPF